MSVFLDILGSILIAFCVILIGMRLTMTTDATGVSSSTTARIMEQMAAAQQTLESDLKNVGYGLPDPSQAIAIADSNRVRLRGDFERNGTMDSVEWYLGKVMLNDHGRVLRMLCRRYDGRPDTIAGIGVSNFRLKYLDRNGQATTVPANVALIELTLGLSSLYKVADQVNPDSMVYLDVIVQQGMVAARNIARHG